MTPAGNPAPAAPRTFSRRTHARARLICFPHAGGAAGGYRGWALDAPWDVEVSAVQYPGRGDRFGEHPAADMTSLVDDVVAGLLREHTADALATTVLFGHSMGAAVAYETARRLAVTGRPPAALVVSGQPAPRRTRGEPCTSRATPNSSRTCAGSAGPLGTSWTTPPCWRPCCPRCAATTG